MIRSIARVVTICFAFTALSAQAKKEADRQFLSGWICTANYTTPERDDKEATEINARLQVQLVKIDGVIHLEDVVGHVYDTEYYGVFKTDLTENVPFKRKPDVYTHHYRFEAKAIATAGAESGMWGTLYVPFEMEDRNAKDQEVHYMFQAGDHKGNTVHLKCNNSI